MSNCFCHFNGYEVKDAAARSSIETLDAQVNKRRFILIADSYGVGITYGDDVTGWTTLFKSKLGLSDTDCIISQEGGSGFIGNVDETFQDLLEKANATSPETITDIVVAGGYNDATKGIENVVNAIIAFCDKAKELYPNAKIHIGMVATSTAKSATMKDNIVNTSLYAYCGLLSGADYAYMSNVENVLRLNPAAWMSADEIHPTAVGYHGVANAIIHAVNGGFVSGSRKFPITLTPAEGVTIIESNIQMAIVNDSARIEIQRLAVNVQGNINPGAYFTIGEFDFPMSGNNPYMGAVAVGYGKNADGFVNVIGTMTIAENKLFLKLHNTKATGYDTGVYMADFSNVVWNVPAVLY